MAKCPICKSEDIGVQHDIWGINRSGNFVPGGATFKLDAGEGYHWNENNNRYTVKSISEMSGNHLNELFNQYGIKQIKKQFLRCKHCGYTFHPDTFKSYTVKP